MNESDIYWDKIFTSLSHSKYKFNSSTKALAVAVKLKLWSCLFKCETSARQCNTLEACVMENKTNISLKDLFVSL